MKEGKTRTEIKSDLVDGFDISDNVKQSFNLKKVDNEKKFSQLKSLTLVLITLDLYFLFLNFYSKTYLYQEHPVISFVVYLVIAIIFSLPFYLLVKLMIEKLRDKRIKNRFVIFTIVFAYLHFLQFLMNISINLVVYSLLLLNLALSYLIFLDAKSRGMRARFWTVLCMLFSLITLPIYMIIRKPKIENEV